MARPFQKEQELFRLIVMHNKLMTAEDLEYFYQDTPDPEEAIKRIVGMGHIDEKTAGKLLKLYRGNLAKIKKKEPEPEADADGGSDDLSPEEEARLMGGGGSAQAKSENPAKSAPQESAPPPKEPAPPAENKKDDGNVAKAELPPEPKQESEESSGESEDDGIPVPGFRLDFKPKASAFVPEPPTEDQLVGPKLKIGDGGQRFLLNLIKLARRLNASDLHVRANAPAWLRINGKLKRLNMEPMPADIAEKAMLSLLSQKLLNQFKKSRAISTYFATEGEVGRVRLEIWRQYHGTECVIRLHELELPQLTDIAGEDVMKLADRMPSIASGLFLIAGGKSSGKTTAVYAMLEHVLKQYQWRALTVESPVEQLIDVAPWQITQRDRGQHIHSPDELLRMLRVQRYDMLLLGQMDTDKDVELALSAAESGCRVLATVANQAPSDCVSRLLRSQVLAGVSPEIALNRVNTELKSITTVSRVMNPDESIAMLSQTVYPAEGEKLNGQLAVTSLLKKIDSQVADLGGASLASQIAAASAKVIG